MSEALSFLIITTIAYACWWPRAFGAHIGVIFAAMIHTMEAEDKHGPE